MAELAAPQAEPSGGYSYNHITTATTTTVKATGGYLRSIIVNLAVAAATITVKDGAGITVGILTCPATVGNPFTIPYDLQMLIGITIVTSGATDLTVVFV